MPLLGMSEAGKRTGYSPAALRRLLQSGGVALVPITARAFAVTEADLEAFIRRNGSNPGPGRPRKHTTEDSAAE